MDSQWQAAGDDAGDRPLWFNPPDGEDNRRRALTRDRVVAEALAIVSAHGEYGQVLISRWPLSDIRIHDISVPGAFAAPDRTGRRKRSGALHALQEIHQHGRARRFARVNRQLGPNVVCDPAHP